MDKQKKLKTWFVKVCAGYDKSACGDCAVFYEEEYGEIERLIDGSAYVLVTPHKCPVCDGTGRVSRPPHIPGDVPAWDTTGTSSYPCRSCVGTGVIWRRQDECT